MRRVRDWRPAPGTVLGTIAVFISLGGVSYAVSTGSIDSREIKNNAVRSRDIRNHTVVGKDVKKDGLKGAAIAESSLGTVPSANTANSAKTANFATLAGSTAGLVHTSPVTQSYGGPDKTLFSLNGFTVFLHCELANTDGGTAVYVKNDSAGSNAAVDGEEASEHGIPENDTFDQGELFLVNASAGGGTPNVDESGNFAAYGTKGALSGSVSVAAEITSTGADCAANGYAVG
jgi:hypothetical protein